MENNRTTFLIGAGTPLDLVLPQDVIKPSTTEITNDVRRVYTDYLTQGDTITIVDDIYYIERGYEEFEKKLASLGAVIEKVSTEKEIQKFTLKVS